MNRGCCNECGYKADYIIDNNNYADNGYEDLNQVPKDKMLCGVCYEENEDEFIDFDKMNNSQKLAFLIERNGYIEDGTGLNEYGHEFRDDNGLALFIDNEENEDE